MKGRRFKIGMVSMEIVASWGKDIGDKIKKALPEGTKILRQQDNFERATLDILLYNDEFKEVVVGFKIPHVVIAVQPNDAKQAPSIILPRH